MLLSFVISCFLFNFGSFHARAIDWPTLFKKSVKSYIFSLSTHLFLWVLDIWFSLGLGITVLMG